MTSGVVMRLSADRHEMDRGIWALAPLAVRVPDRDHSTKSAGKISEEIGNQGVGLVQFGPEEWSVYDDHH